MIKYITFAYLISFSIVKSSSSLPIILTGVNTLLLERSTTNSSTIISLSQPLINGYQIAFASLSNDVAKLSIQTVVIIKPQATNFTVNIRYISFEIFKYTIRWIAVEPFCPLIVGNNLNMKSSNTLNQSCFYSSKFAFMQLYQPIFLFFQVLPVLPSGDLKTNISGQLKKINGSTCLCYTAFNSLNTPASSFVIQIDDYSVTYAEVLVSIQHSHWDWNFEKQVVQVVSVEKCLINCFFGIYSIGSNSNPIFSELMATTNIYIELYDSIQISVNLINFSKNKTVNNAVCNPDWHCRSCNLIQCISCPIEENRILTQALICQCIPGYYGNGFCKKCNFQCKTCQAPTFCFQCIEGYILVDRSCHIFLPKLNYSVSQNIITQLQDFIHKFQLSIMLHSKFFQMMIQLSQPLMFQTIQLPFILSQRIKLRIFQSQQHKTNLQNVYYYSLQQKLILQITGIAAESAVKVSNFGRLICIIFGGLYLMAELIDITNMVSLYIFLSISFPSNLRFILYSLYTCLQASIVPMVIPGILTTYDRTFLQPILYDNLEYSLNFISNNLIPILQLAFFIILYILLGKCALKFQGSNWFTQFLTYSFRKVYKNSVEAFIACQVPICFACATTLLDLRINSLYKAINLCVAIIFLFIFAILPLLHPFYLRTVKQNKRINTSDCYSRAKRHNKWSELYVFSKSFLNSVVSISIPLAPSLVTLCLLISSSCLQVFSTSKTTFHSKIMAFFQICYCSVYGLFHVILLSIFLISSSSPNSEILIQLGYVAIGLICFNILNDLILILYEVIITIKKVIMFKSTSQNSMQFENQVSQKRKKIIKQKTIFINAENSEKPSIQNQFNLFQDKQVKQKALIKKKLVIKMTKHTRIIPKTNSKLSVSSKLTKKNLEEPQSI